jgi:hypothetical protein
MTKPIALEGQTRKQLYETALDQCDTIRLYREQIAFLRAELERVNLMVAIHYTSADRIDALLTEWQVINENGCSGTIMDTLTDAKAIKAMWDESQPGIRHYIRYRHTTPWRTT